MNNPFDQVRRAVSDAKEQLAAADDVAYLMAVLLVGRLRKIQMPGNYGATDTLRKLKKELRDFDMTTGKWK